MDGRRKNCRRWSELFYHRLLAAVEHHDGGILEGRPFNREVEGQAEGVPQAALIELAVADGDVGQLPVVVADGLAVVLCFVGLACLLEQVLQGYGILEYAAILVVRQSERGNKDRVYCHPNIICGSESPHSPFHVVIILFLHGIIAVIEFYLTYVYHFVCPFYNRGLSVPFLQRLGGLSMKTHR